MNDYIELAMRTAAVSPHGDLLHCAMGLATETIEMATAESLENYLEEAGDVMWYVALGCRALGVTLEEAEEMASKEELKEIALAGDFMNQMKREMFYGKPVVAFDLVSLLGSLIGAVRDDVVASGSTLETVMEQNIAKLKKRYPERFTEELAINR